MGSAFLPSSPANTHFHHCRSAYLMLLQLQPFREGFLAPFLPPSEHVQTLVQTLVLVQGPAHRGLADEEECFHSFHLKTTIRSQNFWIFWDAKKHSAYAGGIQNLKEAKQQPDAVISLILLLLTQCLSWRCTSYTPLKSLFCCFFSVQNGGDQFKPKPRTFLKYAPYLYLSSGSQVATSVINMVFYWT